MVEQTTLRVFQLASLIVATTLFASGGACWTSKKVNCDKEYSRSMRFWSSAKMESMYILLVMKICVCCVTALSLMRLCQKKSELFAPQPCGAFWSVQFGFYTAWFSTAYSPFDGSYAKEWAASAGFFFVSALLFAADMLLEQNKSYKKVKRIYS